MTSHAIIAATLARLRGEATPAVCKLDRWRDAVLCDRPVALTTSLTLCSVLQIA